MTLPYAGTPTNHANVTLPEDADEVNEGLWQVPYAQLTDLVRHSQSRLGTLEAADASIHTRVNSLEEQSIGVVVGDKWIPFGLPAPLRNLNARFAPTGTTLEQTSVTDAGELVWLIGLQLPNGNARLKGGRVTVRGGATGGFGVRPDLTVSLWDPSTGAAIQTATTSDPSVNAAAFQAVHTHTTTITPATISGARFARVVLTGESGGLAVVGYEVRSIELLIGL